LRETKPSIKGKEVNIEADNRPSFIDSFMVGGDDIKFEAISLEDTVEIAHMLSGAPTAELTGSGATAQLNGRFFGRKPKWHLMVLQPDLRTLDWSNLTNVTCNIFEMWPCVFGAEALELAGEKEDATKLKVSGKPISDSLTAYQMFALKHGVTGCNLTITGAALPHATLYPTHP
jgi:hypothetical protein